MGICDAYLLKVVTNHTSPSSLAEARVVNHQCLNAVLSTDGLKTMNNPACLYP